MKYKIFTVYDQKAKAHLPPFFLPEQGQAERIFMDSCNDPEHAFGKHPEDYTLIKIGYFDDDDAKLLPLDVPETIGTGIKYVNLEARQETTET